MSEKIYEKSPKVGLVIGTFAAVPYVHLQLENWKRHYPQIPVLVHDDCSPLGRNIHYLCRQYGADFYSLPYRTRRTVGDMSSYVQGMDWACGQGIDIVVKFSRRFIPLHNWVPGLQATAMKSQFPTFSQRCVHFNFGFRTECIGFHLNSWESGLARIRETVEKNEPQFVEGFLHILAREIPLCEDGARYSEQNPRENDCNAYAVWDIMDERRVTKRADLLWHDSDEPLDYARASHLYGLPYSLDDFLDTNQGFGIGDE